MSSYLQVKAKREQSVDIQIRDFFFFTRFWVDLVRVLPTLNLPNFTWF